jgi:hypothetical protein
MLPLDVYPILAQTSKRNLSFQQINIYVSLWLNSHSIGYLPSESTILDSFPLRKMILIQMSTVNKVMEKASSPLLKHNISRGLVSNQRNGLTGHSKPIQINPNQPHVEVCPKIPVVGYHLSQ